MMRTEIAKIFCVFLQTSGHPDTTGSDFNGPEKFNFIQILNKKFFVKRYEKECSEGSKSI